MNLKPGQKAPAISLADQCGKVHQLKDYLGQWVLVYFYPKDDTPGCTKEACGLRDNFPKFKKSNAVILGISADSQAKHQKFVTKYKLPFTLLSDESHEVLEKYGVWAEKKFLGKKYMGILRTSFLIDPTGKISKIYERVKPELHASEVLEDLLVISKE